LAPDKISISEMKAFWLRSPLRDKRPSIDPPETLSAIMIQFAIPDGMADQGRQLQEAVAGGADLDY
jgi:hypothetical protein